MAVAVAAAFDLPLRDPDGVAGPPYVRLPAIVVLLFLADIAPCALRSTVAFVTSCASAGSASAPAGPGGLASFSATYVSYRNLKGAVPFARPQLRDGGLLALDRAMALGRDPAAIGAAGGPRGSARSPSSSAGG